MDARVTRLPLLVSSLEPLLCCGLRDMLLANIWTKRPGYRTDFQTLRLISFRLQAMGKDPRLVAGAGATEIELAKRLREYGRKETG